MRTTNATYAILDAPSILGLKPSGVERLGATLRAHGLGERIGARYAGCVPPPVYDARRDPESGMLNVRSIAEYTHRLADAIGELLERGEFPLVLGGDCSIVLGSMLAVRRRGRYGLLFIDGHADFYQPEANINGEAASSDLALVTGHGPALLTTFEGTCPAVRPDDVVVFGYRDTEEQAQYGSQPLPPELPAFDLSEVRMRGVAKAMGAALAQLTRDELAGFWIHLDADVLDDTVMPAVDYRMPGGLTHAELTTALTLAIESGRAVGLEVTIYNPALDGDGSAGRELARTLERALAANEAAHP